MRHRPATTHVMPLEEALRRYCEEKDVVFGVLYQDFYPNGRIIARLTFGRKRAFWQVSTCVLRRKPDFEDRLYNNLTRALDRKMKSLGWKP